MKKLMMRAMLALAVSLVSQTVTHAEELSPLLKGLLGSGDLFNRGLPERALKWKCVPFKKFECTKEGCQATPPAVWVMLDFQTSSYSRCDKKGCDRYGMASSMSGIYTSIELLGRSGTLFKAVNDGSEFVEAITIGTNLLSSYGTCSPSP